LRGEENILKRQERKERRVVWRLHVYNTNTYTVNAHIKPMLFFILTYGCPVSTLTV
jgi:hypothetical protein